MAIEKALSIRGWMTEPELWWLAIQASSRKKIVELGSYYGRSTRAIGDNTPGIVYAVDHFNGPADVSLLEFERTSIWPIFSKNLSDLIASGKVVPIKTNHEQFDPPNDDFDMIFIDGDHRYEATKRDIKRWIGKCRKPALISGHDYSHPGVRQAVNECFTDINIFEEIWSIWII